MTRREDGRWQEKITVTVGGRKKQKYFYGKTKAEIYKKIAAYSETAENGMYFSDVLDEFWEQHQQTLSPNTLKSYKPAVERAKNYFTGTYIKNITAPDINVFMRQTIRDNAMAQKTAKTQLMILNLAFKYAVQMGYASVNAAREIEIQKGLPKQSREIASDADIEKIKASYGTGWIADFAYWILYTGCRRSELLALTWEDVDIKNRTITINKSRIHVNGRYEIKPPKTEAGNRTVPILNKLAEKIKLGHGLIFAEPVTGRIVSDGRFEKAWAGLQKRLGITCTPHQLRHAYATMLYEQNVPVKDAQELLGHAQASTTEDIYTHIRDARKKQIFDKLMDADLETGSVSKVSESR